MTIGISLSVALLLILSLPSFAVAIEYEDELEWIIAAEQPVETLTTKPWTSWPRHEGYELIELYLPFPSGVLLSEQFTESPETGERFIHRIGRVEHSAVAIREKWVPVASAKEVLSKSDCAAIIEAAEKHAASHGGWNTGRHPNYPTTGMHNAVYVFLQLYVLSTHKPTFICHIDLPVYSVLHQGTELRASLDKGIDRIFAEMAKHYGLEKSKLRVSDLFIAKYDATVPGRQKELGPHVDKSQWSFVLALNTDFTEGGTYFFDLEQMWLADTGNAVLFHGMHMHAGYAVSSGIRYIIAGFCDYGDGSMHDFMVDYDPITDGYAAGAGFQTGDIVRGIEECYLDKDVGRVVKRVAAVDQLDAEQWRAVAQSCETMTPNSPTRMIVERRIS